jgi:PASTA domain
MRYQVRQRLRVVLLVPLIAFLFGAGSTTAGYAAPAAAAASAAGQVPGTSAFTYVPLPATTFVKPHKGEEDESVLKTLPFTMQQGDVLRVTDQLEVRIPSGDGSQTDNKVICYGHYEKNGKVIWNEINEVSSGTNVGAGVNGRFPYQWNVSMLITPLPQDSPAGYYCQIVTYDGDSDTGGGMDVLPPPPGQTFNGTWMEVLDVGHDLVDHVPVERPPLLRRMLVSSGSEAGAQEWPFFTNCHPDDSTGSCQYIGSSGRPSAKNLVAPDWLAADHATTFDAVATFQITDCWAGWFGHGSSSCAPDDRGDGIFGMSGSEGKTWLEADQLYPNGSVCQVNQAYSEDENTFGQVGLSENYYDSDNQHHLPLYYDLSAPISPLCAGSRLFRLDLHIGWSAGNPVKLDGGNINVINGYARTTVVPDVTGLTQAQADAAIKAAGLYAPAPDWVASPAPPGTVLDEYPPAGTSELEDLPVQLTLSAGQVTVPNVYRYPVFRAEAAIKSAGLVPIIKPTDSCVDSGIVLGQNPGDGTQVAPGSQVDIGINVCTR